MYKTMYVPEMYFDETEWFSLYWCFYQISTTWLYVCVCARTSCLTYHWQSTIYLHEKCLKYAITLPAMQQDLSIIYDAFILIL